MDPAIRLYQDADYAALCSLEQKNTPGECKPAVFVRQAGVLFPTTFFVAEKGGAIIGYTIGACLQHDPSRAWIIRLAVNEEERRQGLGRDLVATVIDALRRMGIREVLLSVSPENLAARSLYETFGFANVGFHAGYFGTGADRIIMSRIIG
ncbi:GNAT family N-acetyltransferase [Methanoculleus sp. FWC-SCC1]|uniref:GNAT family N-acetyltransferase n=1 Tax=Methanoculleus frigidifontis TaxID=2584085 RepID=A0ABT8MC77_9EURY|nr:GNAT family N-acetyltransferase [Methanoculleus sp. FWC-SCC1]MDN7025532.1 GNAT family N-acetyltransferase [Methanoculleus sp. FWC-SCC1]